jgi:hypothetical protein
MILAGNSIDMYCIFKVKTFLDWQRSKRASGAQKQYSVKALGDLKNRRRLLLPYMLGQHFLRLIS